MHMLDTPTQPPRHLYGILGQPLGHSLSPALHNWAFQRLGHPAAYFAWEKGLEELPAFFDAVRTLPIDGLSVTIPHKEAVAPFLDGLTARAQSVGAVNTVFRENDRLMGDNTDVAGFLAPLQNRELPDAALLLGAGGVCRAALAGLREIGINKVAVAARTPAKAKVLQADFGCDLTAWDKRGQAVLDLAPLLVINATPLGMSGHLRAQSPLPESLWRMLAQKNIAHASSLVYDLVYTPVETMFLLQAREAGLPCLDGMGFFMAQAMEQLRLWTGSAVPGDIRAEARDLLAARLA